MTPVLWAAVVATLMALTGAAMALAGRGERRQLAGRIAEVQPELVETRGPASALRTIRVPHFILLDRLIGINREMASDAVISTVMCLIMGALGGCLLFVVAHFLLTIDKPYAIGVAVLAGLMAARISVARRRIAVQDRMEDELSQALGVIIRCVRVGLPVVEGMRAVSLEIPAPTGPEFRRAVDQIHLGEAFDVALQGLAQRCALPAYRFFAVSVSLQRQTGGNLSETLDNLADTLRKRKALRLKVKALISEPMATVTVLSVLPFVVGAILMAVRPDYVMTLFTTETGRFILGIAVVIQCMGLLVIRTMIKQTLA